MPTNKHFNHVRDHSEQDLHADIVAEYIQVHGIDVVYIPRTNPEEDYLFGEDPNVRYENAYEIEVYPQDYESFGGDGELISRFGFEVRDQWKLLVSRRRFEQVVAPHLPDGVFKPRDGDLISGMFAPGRIWEIKYVPDEAENDFFQFGKKFTWEVGCELWSYNQETVNTGVSPIDLVAEALQIDSQVLLDNIEPEAADNLNLEAEAFNNDIVDFSEGSPFGNIFEQSEVINYLELTEAQYLAMIESVYLSLDIER